MIWLEGDPGLENVTVSNNVLDTLGDPAIPDGRVVLVNNTQA